MVAEIDLRELQEKARKERMYGEALIKFEDGEIKQICITQKFKPQEFDRLVFVKIEI